MKNTNPIEDLQEIRKMMENSSKFLSLSGLSGVFAGIVALAGAFGAHLLIEKFIQKQLHYYAIGKYDEAAKALEMKLIGIAAAMLILAVGGGLLITAIKAKKNGEKLVSPVSWRLLLSLMIPLSFGGLFTLGLYYQATNVPQLYYLIPPATLIFYGMSLLNASKYVHVDIKYLALSEMLLGVILVFKPAWVLPGWALGFGVLHILYGIIMYFKYDYKK
ncbi:hypothetical protein K6119_17115 [Paracrocinitomix mangrovi]|uniref:hypothetical protein n=1 Tax=Paracrocinitomix mangrovi TaxID=2862509 RepID=UPI001C8F1C4F|nr:hypothetical protein [Paracrocinitomix mangrovi]UKN01448.1 hypothetical protein K6119_17115 [Paracrocinitomix mangrovi]